MDHIMFRYVYCKQCNLEEKVYTLEEGWKLAEQHSKATGHTTRVSVLYTDNGELAS